MARLTRPLPFAALLLVIAVTVAAGLAFVARGDASGPIDPADPPPSDEWAEQHLQDSIAAQTEFQTKIWPTLGLDLSTLPRVNFMASYATEFGTLGDAARGVEAIAHVKVTGVRFTGQATADVTATVIGVWKGDAAESITFEQMAAVDRADDGDISIVEPEIAPLLVPGDEAVVFLAAPSKEWTGLPHLVMFTGWYKLDSNGRLIVPEPAPPSTAALAGKTLDDLKAAVDRALAK